MRATTSQMKMFVLQRNTDVSGTSGTGIVAEGVQFTNGMCALTWLSPLTSVSVYTSVDTLLKIHGHDGATELVWKD